MCRKPAAVFHTLRFINREIVQQETPDGLANRKWMIIAIYSPWLNIKM